MGSPEKWQGTDSDSDFCSLLLSRFFSQNNCSIFCSWIILSQCMKTPAQRQELFHSVTIPSSFLTLLATPCREDDEEEADYEDYNPAEELPPYFVFLHSLLSVLHTSILSAGLTPLTVAVQSGHGGCVMTLLSHNGTSPLPPRLVRAAGGDIDTVEKLAKEQGSRKCVDLRDGHLKTALHYAPNAGQIKVVEFLVRICVDVNKADLSGETASSQGHLSVVQYLVAHSANINQTNNHDESPLHAATHARNFPVARFLLCHGARVSECDSSGYTPLLIAAKQGDTEMVLLLLNHRADVNKTSFASLYTTPLYLAMYYGTEEVVNILKLHAATL